jgi:1-deoxy-D-xylulose-5-phosphate reductoisomerase
MPTARLDLTRTGVLSFFEPDPVKFPCLRLARAALDCGGTAPVVLNAANEVAVAAFLDRRLPFVEIPELIERAHDGLPSGPLASIEQCVAVDADARRRVQEWVGARAGGSTK